MKKPLSFSKTIYITFLCTLLCFTAIGSLLSLGVAYEEHQASLELMERYNEAAEKLSYYEAKVTQLQSQQQDMENQLEEYEAILAEGFTAQIQDIVTTGSSLPYNEPTSEPRQSTDHSKAEEPSGVGKYFVTASGSKYHTEGCSYLKKSKIAISLSQAKAEGYGPCSRCIED